MSRLGGHLLAMAMMFGAMGGGSPFGDIYERDTPRPKRNNKILDAENFPEQIRFNGDIPKGQKLESIGLAFEKESHLLLVEVDIVYGTLASRLKKLNTIEKKVTRFIQANTLTALRRYEASIEVIAITN